MSHCNISANIFPMYIEYTACPGLTRVIKLNFKIMGFVGNPEQFMKLKKFRKLNNVEDLDGTTKKVLMVMILTLTEMKSSGEFGSDEKVASILQLARLLFYSTVKRERSGKDRTRNGELENIFKHIKQNLRRMIILLI